jgi:GT2 family glycosyltransferase
MPIVVVIIVTYNGERWIGECLDCLRRSSQAVKTIIVDNASSDKTKTIIKSAFPDVTLIEEEQNLGFGQANNIALRIALQENADYVFLLNQDAYIYPDTISELLSVHSQHKAYGIISPLQLNGSGERLDIRFKKYMANNYAPGLVESVESGDTNLPMLLPIRFVNAAAWLISRECLERTGLFHPLFYHYGEDNNYCSRAQYHGFKAGIATRVSVRHDRSNDPSDARSLSREIRVVPLYLLLDLRKPFFLAYILTCWKLVGYIWKGISQWSAEILKQTVYRIKWMITHMALIRKTRKEMKQPYAGTMPGKLKLL